MWQDAMREQVPLAPLTTLQLGGNARWLVPCANADDVRGALTFARERSLPAWVLGGGSNTIVPDDGFPGVVLWLRLTGVRVTESGDRVRLVSKAGQSWDALVSRAAAAGWSGIECLAGIPGTVGGAPIQNIGAYGQALEDTLVFVRCLDRATLAEVELSREACEFGYRTSRFKGREAGRWIVLEVTLELAKDRRPSLRHDELARAVGGEAALQDLTPREAVQRVREAVLALRRGKGMVVDAADPDTRSVGSFFMNPVLSAERFAELERRWAAAGGAGAVPAWRTASEVKVSAAWLVEHAGFARGLRLGGVGVSAKHALALVSCGGTTGELLDLAARITAGVEERFGVRLEREPVLMAP